MIPVSSRASNYSSTAAGRKSDPFDQYLSRCDLTESDLVEALRARKIAGAAIDVFDQEPLPPNHPFRTMTNVLATPHIGYVSRGLYETLCRDTVANIRRWLEESPTGTA